MNSTNMVAGLVLAMGASLCAMDLQREHSRALSRVKKSLERVIEQRDTSGLGYMVQYSDWVTQEQKNEAAAAALTLQAPDVTLAWVKVGARVTDGLPMLLGYATRAGDDETVAALCDQGANKEDALMLAVGSGKFYLVKALVKRGANVYTGHSLWSANAPLYLAQQHAGDVAGCAEIVKYLEGFYMILRDGTLKPYHR